MRKLIKRFTNCLSKSIETTEMTDGSFTVRTTIGHLQIKDQHFQVQLTIVPKGRDWLEHEEVSIGKDVQDPKKITGNIERNLN